MGVKPYLTASKLTESKSDFLDILDEHVNKDNEIKIYE